VPPDHDPEHWSNRPATIFIAGAAALLLIGVLIFAVTQIADDSPTLPDTFVAPTSSTPSSTWKPSTTTTTSYAPPSPQTSEQNLPVPSSPTLEDRGPSTPTSEDTPDPGTVTETASLLPPPP
jgi:cytoskeletal protein RodZ